MAEARGMGRGWGAVLVISLALNLAVVGLVAGAALRWQGGPPAETSERAGPARGAPVFALGPYGRALDRDGRAEWRAMAMARSDDLARGRAALRADVAALAALLQAEHFDAEAARDLLARQRANARAQEAIAHEILLEQLAGMPAENRRALAERLTRRGPR
ncbi:MAG: periplasmic heavy metal sensor [Rhodobacteraceae bacterium]|nr:periplasmic heavy metal sensor [Paracoccaceae bacterium]